MSLCENFDGINQSLKQVCGKDVVAKSIGTSNPHNMIKATFMALKSIQAPRSVAAKRGRKVAEVLGKTAEQTEAS